MTRLLIDIEQIERFVNAIFLHASDGQFISLRTFPDEGANDKALRACLRRGFPGLGRCDSWGVGLGEDRRSCPERSWVGAPMRPI